jgi:redox-sensitive bicupin YhaK (pirin superfamily)
MAILSNTPGAAGVTVEAGQDSRFLLISGQPLNEPIAQWGPFVMNTREQVEQAIDDFRAGRF